MYTLLYEKIETDIEIYCKKSLNIKFNIKSNNRPSVISNNSNSSVDSVNTSAYITLRPKIFDIVISAEKWQTIKPIKKNL